LVIDRSLLVARHIDVLFYWTGHWQYPYNRWGIVRGLKCKLVSWAGFADKLGAFVYRTHKIGITALAPPFIRARLITCAGTGNDASKDQFLIIERNRARLLLPEFT
jgi:hypothetical protein